LHSSPTSYVVAQAFDIILGFQILGVRVVFVFLQATCAAMGRVLVSRTRVQFPHKLLQFVR